MRALTFDGQQLQLDKHYRDPRPAEGEALVRVLLAGICGTDLEILRGYAGFTGVFGHEFVGQVAACATQPELVGQRVVAEINLACGRCSTCLAGRREHCPQRSVLGIRGHDGAFADFVTVPVENLHLVPDAVPDEVAVFVEPLAAALRIRDQIALRPSDRVLVLGDGKLGQLVARSLASTGCDLVVLGRTHERRGMALLRALGVATVLQGDVAAGWADVVVECTGSPSGFELALELLRPEGTLVLKSTYSGPGQADLTQVVVNEIRIVGSRCGPFAPAIRVLVDKTVDPLPLIDAIYPLDESYAAFQHGRQSGVMKILLKP